jgi:hypothetical protein
MRLGRLHQSWGSVWAGRRERGPGRRVLTMPHKAIKAMPSQAQPLGA